ncbi:D-amino acid aminotransferase [Paraferrimonas sp. SM1919]|uniref:D-amino acid aminotransferase n=1 Tax=Paraferrimonas sp. SM1919 TaxID=2662263 RepID=UPI0013D17313|nr:D-amino acid aminotransferase [Paraferrimonas sp. SM1919]
MSIVFLNGDFLAAEEAKISPMDRGFLFGEGIYEVLPSYQGKFIGLAPHLKRMQNGLNELDIANPMNDGQWQQVILDLIAKNEGDNLGVYLQVTRGASEVRQHGYPQQSQPTVFAFTFTIDAVKDATIESAKTYEVSATQDLRWQRCHIKSTSLLGNVMHYQQAKVQGCQEMLLVNGKGEVTEASSSNVFMVKDDVIYTAPLDNQILPGVTRAIVLDILRSHGQYKVLETPFTLEQAAAADELWLTSSTKEIAPIVMLNGKPIADGKAGPVWLQAQTLFNQYKFLY